LGRNLQPRLVRLKDAPAYLGVDKNFFNREIRPCLTEVRLGARVSFDLLDLDDWVDRAKRRYGPSPPAALYLPVTANVRFRG
jgi:hypothetical protein